MEDSILVSIKNTRGLVSEYTPFDEALIMYINMALSTLTQLGVGPSKGFRITGDSETWDEFIDTNDPRLEMVKAYVDMRVHLIFDPPGIGAVMTSLQEMIKEYESRINYMVDPGGES